MTRPTDIANERRSPWPMAIAVLAASVVLAGRYRILLMGGMPIGADNALFYYPLFSLARVHPFLLWNPFEGVGMPLDGNWQAAVLYLPRLVYALADASHVHGAFTLGHYIWGLVGVFILLRKGVRLSAGACYAGALVFALGPYIHGRVSNPSLFYSSVWAPWALLAAVHVARSPEKRTGPVVLGLTMAALTLAGSPHMAFFGWLIVGLLLFAEMIGCGLIKTDHHARSRRDIFLLTRATLIAGALWAAIISPTLIRSIQTLPNTLRAATTFDELVKDALPPSWIFKGLLGGMTTPEWTDRAIYPGVIALACVVLALVLPGRRRLLFPLLLAGFGFWLAIGRIGGLYQILGSLPGTRFLINPSRALILVVVGLTLAVAIATDAIGRLHPVRFRSARSGLPAMAASLAGIAVLVVACGQYGFAGVAEAWFDPVDVAADRFRWANVGGNLLLIGVLLSLFVSVRVPRAVVWIAALALMTYDTARFCERIDIPFGSPDEFAPSSGVAVAQELAAANPAARFMAYEAPALNVYEIHDHYQRAHAGSRLPLLYRLPSIQVYDPLAPGDYADLVEALGGRQPFDDPFRSITPSGTDQRLLDLLGVEAVIGDVRERSLTRKAFGVGAAPLVFGVGATGKWDGLGLVYAVDRPDGRATAETAGVLRVTGAERTQEFTVAIPRNEDGKNPRLFREWRGMRYWHAQYWFDGPMTPQSIGLQADADSDAQWYVTHVTWLSQASAGSLERVSDDDVWPPVYRNPSARPRAWLVDRVEAIADRNQRLARLASAEFNARATAIVEAPIELGLHSGETIAKPAGAVRLIDLEPMSARWDVYSNGSLLVVSQQFDAGWDATVDGKPATAVRSNHCLTGVIVPPGRHEVELRYRPVGFLFGLVLMVVATLASSAWMLAPLVKKKGRDTECGTGAPAGL